MSANELELEIAGMGITLDIANNFYAEQARERYADFIVARGSPQAVVRVQVIAGARFVANRPGPWIIETKQQDSRLFYRSYFDAGWVDFMQGTGALQIAPEVDVENFLRVVYAHLCLRNDALLLHASGVMRDANGFVFFGASGNGKTTVARLSLERGFTVLSDDLVILKKCGKRFRVFGVPFHGTMPEAPRTNASGDLLGLFALAKDTRHFLVDVPSSRAVSHLVACAPFVMAEAANASRVVKFCSELNTEVPVRELHFRRDSGFWDVLDGLE